MKESTENSRHSVSCTIAIFITASGICSTCRKKHKQVVSREKWLHPVEEEVPEPNVDIAIDSQMKSR